MSSTTVRLGTLAMVVTAAACAPSTSAPPPAPVPASERSVRLEASGAPQALEQDTQPDLQMAAGVVRLDMLTAQGDTTVKLFGTAGGDPAMNGLYTYLAVFGGPAEGWRVFRIGDFLEYRVLSESAQRLDLEVGESVMHDATGEIGKRTRRLIVQWTVAPDDGPVTVTVTDAK